MKIYKLLVLIPALMLPLTFAGCDQGGDSDVVDTPTEEESPAPGAPESGTTTPDAPAGEEPAGEEPAGE